jgi:hypothetical protein
MKRASTYRHINYGICYSLLKYWSNCPSYLIIYIFFRSCSVFNSFICNLPQVLDQNHLMGGILMPTCILLLQYCPCPPHHITPECQSNPNYSLWYLEPHVRKSWLISLLVLLYKVINFLYILKQTNYGVRSTI